MNPFLDPPPEHPGDEVLARGRFVRLIRREGWEFIDQPGLRGLVAVVAVTPAGGLLLVEQHRTPLDGRTLELPAGMVEQREAGRPESFEQAAARELEEETGWRAGRIDYLTCVPASPGRIRYYLHYFRATALARVHAGGGDAFENITVHELPVAAAEAWLKEQAARGLRADATVLVALYFLQREARG